MIEPYKGKYIWIVGASTGIGRALAVELSAQGATLALSARSEDKLVELNKELGDLHHVFPFDVGDDHAVFEASKAIDKALPRLDSMIFMAATYTPGSFEENEMLALRKAVDINLNGAFATVLASHDVFKRQGDGQIVLCGSVAGYRGLPNSQPYSATKAALINLAETLRIDLAKSNIDVKIINPGFVRTPLTDKNDFKMPMIIEAKDAAKVIAKELLTSRFEIHFPKRFTFIMKLLQVLPARLYFKMMSCK